MQFLGGLVRKLSNEYSLAKRAFDTAENEPCIVCRTLARGRGKPSLVKSEGRGTWIGSRASRGIPWLAGAGGALLRGGAGRGIGASLGTCAWRRGNGFAGTNGTKVTGAYSNARFFVPGKIKAVFAVKKAVFAVKQSNIL